MTVGETATRMVDNPFYVELKRLRAEVARQKDDIKSALDRAAKDFGQGEVFTGPKAKDLTGEIEGRKQQVHAAVGTLLDAIDDRLRAMDPKIPEERARMYRMAQRGAI